MEDVKLITIFVFLSIGFSNAKLTCPEDNEDGETYFPSDTNCSEFFQCIHGVPVMRECPDGLQWDQASSICNWPDQISPPCTADCPSLGWIRQDRVSNCYLFGTERMNFAEAQQFCEDNGGKLVEPRRPHESFVIDRMISQEAGEINFWIGLTDIDNEGTFKWQSDNSDVSYSNWNLGEPNNARGNEDCALLRKMSSLYKWSDSICNGQYSLFTANTALCQKF